MFNKNLKIVLRDVERQPFMQSSDALAWMMVAMNWLSIIALLVLCGWVVTPWVWIPAIILLGGRQLGLAVLMHETAHHSLFADRRLNLIVGQWLCAAPILADHRSYSKTHRWHHERVGREGDPDFEVYGRYPMDRSLLLGKVVRDLTGVTFLRMMALLWNGGYNSFTGMAKGWDSGIWFRSAVVHIIMFAVLVRIGAGLGVVAWWLAFCSTYMLFARIRVIAEHAVTRRLDAVDPRLNTRTTYAGMLERFTVAPNFVNYHLDHHILPKVPAYHLPEFHRYLKRQGAFTSADIQPSYWEVLRRCVT